MGLETAAFLFAGSEVAKSVLEIKAANEKTKALELESKQMQLQTQQKTLANYDTMEKVLQSQEAHMTTTGLAFSSPSFNAIQRQTYNIGAKKQANIDIEGDIQQENIDFEKRNVRNTLFGQLFGNVAETAAGAFEIYKQSPSIKPQEA